MDVCFYERKSFFKNVPDATIFSIDIGIESCFEILQYIIVAFEKSNVNGQTNDSSVFNEMNVIECFCKITNVSYLDDRMTINYGANKSNVGYKQIVFFI